MASRTSKLSSRVGEFREGEIDENPLPPTLLAGPQGPLPHGGGEWLFTLVSFFFSFFLFFSDVWGFFPTHGSVTHFPSFPLSPLPSCFCHCYGDLVHTVQVTDLGRAELSPKAQISAKPT